MKQSDVWKKSLFFILAFCIGAGIGLFIDRALFHVEKCDLSYRFINKEFWCAYTHAINKKEYVTFKRVVAGYINELREEKRILRAGVYFRDLEEGPWFGINEKTTFIPASLLKFPLLLTYLRISENTGDILGRNLSFFYEGETTSPFFEAERNVHEIGFSRKEVDLQKQFFKSSQTVEENKTYSVDELLFLMIAFSDNMAYNMLYNYLEFISSSSSSSSSLSDALVLETYQDMGILDPKDGLSQSLSPRSYASMFRILYNVSYLSKPLSEKALGILASSDFNKGLVAGIPSDIRVAHKFGERTAFFENGQQIKELHDCGIVYFPENPYLLCIMTEGEDFEELAKAIQTISAMVYEEVDSRRI